MKFQRLHNLKEIVSKIQCIIDDSNTIRLDPFSANRWSLTRDEREMSIC